MVNYVVVHVIFWLVFFNVFCLYSYSMAEVIFRLINHLRILN